MSSKVPGSFRDPAGFLFVEDGILLRSIHDSYAEHYQRLMSSGLGPALQAKGLLIPHKERDPAPYRKNAARVHAVLEPELLSPWSYPYEWSFSQLKDAALCTLEIQKLALDHGMSLKDASAYNIQFRNGRPVLVDTLSFETLVPGRPWVAYRQFCQHFLAPLVLDSLVDIRLGHLSKSFIDGIPLDLASKLLPRRTWLKPGILSHIHLHAGSQKRHAAGGAGPAGGSNPSGGAGSASGGTGGKAPAVGGFSLLAFRGLIDSLESLVRSLSWNPSGTEWGDYYEGTNYSTGAFAAKEALVESLIAAAGGKTLIDLGANNGHFSRKAADLGRQVISCDIDPAAVEKNYLRVKKEGETRLLPLVIDLTNPSPALGWENEERTSFLVRGRSDTALALALVHHLAISNNLPLERIAEAMARLSPNLIIEFVPKEDSQVRRLLATREDVFPQYERNAFEAAFGEWFRIEERRPVPETERTLYLMRRLPSGTP